MDLVHPNPEDTMNTLIQILATCIFENRRQNTFGLEFTLHSLHNTRYGAEEL